MTIQALLLLLQNSLAKGEIDPQEPVFLLRGTDPLTPEVVRDWSRRARAFGVDREKCVAARRQGDLIEDWQLDGYDRRKVPT